MDGQSDQALADLLRSEGIYDERVLQAIARLDRRRFVRPEFAPRAGGNYPLPIGHGQTISQPYVVAFMTQALELHGDERVLEIGTGSGYQTAVLAQLCREVYTVEIIRELAEGAWRVLDSLGVRNVRARVGDGSFGWPEAAPFDAVLVAAAPEEMPNALVEQLRPGGRLVIPLGAQEEAQELLLLEKREDGRAEARALLPVRFVPMTGGAQHADH